MNLYLIWTHLYKVSNRILRVVVLRNIIRLTQVGVGGVITVLHEVRKVLSIGNGGLIEWIYEDGRIIMKKVGRNG